MIAFFMAIFLCSEDMFSQRFSYEQFWTSIDKSKPKSSEKKILEVLNIARKEKNTQQILKAKSYYFSTKMSYVEDSLQSMIQDIERELPSIKDPVERSLTYMLLAKIYTVVYLKDSYLIDKRSLLQGYVPKDINEWTKNVFVEHVVGLFSSALNQPEILQKVPFEDFDKLLERTNDKPFAMSYPTLYDLALWLKNECLGKFVSNSDMLQREITSLYSDSSVGVEKNDLLSIQLQTLSELKRFYVQRKDNLMAVYTDLQMLFLRSLSADERQQELCVLEKKYDGTEAWVEVMIAQADEIMRAEMNNDSRRKVYEIAQRVIRMFPKYGRTAYLQNIKDRLDKKSIQTYHQNYALPFSTISLEIVSENIENLNVKVYLLQGIRQEEILRSNGFDSYEGFDIKRSKLVYEATHKVDYKSRFDNVHTKIDIPTFDFGKYYVVVDDEEKKQDVDYCSLTSFFTTNIGIIYRAEARKELPQNWNTNYNEKNTEFYVVDRQSGKPYGDVLAKFYKENWSGNGQRKFTFMASASGDKTLKYRSLKDAQIISLEKDNDRFFVAGNAFGWYDFSLRQDSSLRVALFTDRSLYRPGQKVLLKGIAYKSFQGYEQVANANTKVRVTLVNPQYEAVSEQEFTTNEFGSFSGEFLLPESCMSGTFFIRANGKYQGASIRVEEYKLPSFMAEFYKIQDEIRFGNEVKISGKASAMAGYPMQNAKVRYRIFRTPHPFCWWIKPDKIEVLGGETTTDEQGLFSISFVPKKEKNNNYQPKCHDIGSFYVYQIEALVTDTKGETQETYSQFCVGDKSIMLNASIPELWQKNNSLAIQVDATNVNGQSIVVKGRYEIHQLSGDFYYEDRGDTLEYTKKKLVMQGEYASENPLILNLKSLKSGLYSISFSATDAWGDTVRIERQIQIVAPSDKKTPMKARAWAYKEEVGDNNTKVYFGTSLDKAYVLYELMLGDVVIESRWVEMSDEVKAFSITSLQSYPVDLYAIFTIVRDQQIFRKTICIPKKYQDKTLKPRISTFRDKLRPGDNVQWTIEIPELSKIKYPAELLATMYDSSIDQLQPHSWIFTPNYRHQPFTPLLFNGYFSKTMSDSYYQDFQSRMVRDFDIYSLDFGLDFYGYSYSRPIRYATQRSANMKFENSSVDRSNYAVAESNVASVEEKVSYDVSDLNIAGQTKTHQPEDLKIRSNFQETAFFYPHILVDKNGKASFSFTMPESLTKWHFKALSHTKDLYSGQIEEFVYTQQDLMIEMNLPRFVRRSDSLCLMANITNMTDSLLMPQVYLEIIEPKTEQVIYRLPVKSIAIEPNSTKSIKWSLSPFADCEIVVIRAVAFTDNFQDGEQRYLPILPDKVILTESMPIRTGRGGKEKSFLFDTFIRKNSDVQTVRYKLEYSSNPVWYAIQALSSLVDVDSDNAISILAALYANRLGGFIVENNPKIKQNFDKWLSVDTAELLSPLQKQSELKNISIDESPWSKTAKDESYRKRQLSLLLDEKKASMENSKLLAKLLKFQTSNGGFCWFDGMQESWYVTVEVLDKLHRLCALTGSQLSPSINDVERRALQWLDQKFVSDFDWLRKHNENYEDIASVGSSTILYMYLRASYSDYIRPKSTDEAWKFYSNIAYKHWDKHSLLDKALITMLSVKEGRGDVALSITESLKEFSLQTEEMGMYWQENIGGYLWQEHKIKVQSALIEAFRTVYGECAAVDEMRIWLLKQKQTQSWDSPISTADAVYALLNYGKNPIMEEPRVDISVGSVKIDDTDKTAGVGYFSEEFDVSNLSADMGKISVSSDQSVGMSWGAVYWQYYDDISHVGQGDGVLSITKDLYREERVGGKRTLKPISQRELHIGDRIVCRMVVRTDRDMEFVTVRDLRAACLEPVEQISRYVYREGVGYYLSTKDSSIQMFFDFLPKGTYVFEYDVWVNNSGSYSSGLAEVQCQYAPEFTSHSRGEKIIVK